MYIFAKKNEMTTKKLKLEIEKLLNNVPDDVLKNLLDFMKQVQQQTSDQLELSNYIKKILKEDKQLLKKLAK